LEETYRAELHAIADRYETALAQAATTRLRHQHHLRWHAYEQARRKQREVYREIQRQWEELFARYRHVLLGQQGAQE